MRLHHHGFEIIAELTICVTDEVATGVAGSKTGVGKRLGLGRAMLGMSTTERKALILPLTQ